MLNDQSLQSLPSPFSTSQNASKTSKFQWDSVAVINIIDIFYQVPVSLSLGAFLL